MDSTPSLDDLVKRWHQLRQRGQTLSLQELCAEAPEQVDDLRQHLQAVAAMESFLGVNESGTASTLNPSPPPANGGEQGAAGLPAGTAGYEILGELGRGAMGVVYKARQTKLNRVVALKTILSGAHAGEAERQRFLAEAEAVARLQHPNIVQIHEIGEADGRSFFSLELCPGGSLADKFDGTPMRAREAARLVETLARAMQAAHEAGIVHRDLKPANVLLAADGTPKIADFGLAKKLDSAVGQTASGAILGTPSYMAPEQAAGKTREVGPAADVYALGAILYELLTGRPPFKAATAFDTVLQVVSDEPVPPGRLNTQVPADVETICLMCLRKEPARRYGSAADLAEDLRLFQAGAPVKARRVAVLERCLKWARRHPAAAAAYGLLVLVLVLGGLGGGAAALWQRSEQAREQLAVEKRESESARARLAEVSYLHQVGWAHQEGQDASVARAEQLLHSCPPEMRGWEWRYVRRLCHSDLCTLDWQGVGIRSVAFSPDGRRLATGCGDMVKLWDAASGQLVQTCRGDRSSMTGVRFSPDGTRLASASRDHTARVWDAATGALVCTLEGHANVVNSLCFSPDGTRVATSSEDNTVRLWDARSGRELRTLKGHDDTVVGLSFSHDGRRLASSSTRDRKGEVKVWDVQAGQQVLSIRHSGGVHGIDFSPDGRRLAGAGSDGTVRLWDAQTGQVLLTISGHTNRVLAVAFSPDGTLLASGSMDQTARVWDAATGQQVACHRGHKNDVIGVPFSPDGTLLASASQDGTVKVWRATADSRCVILRGHTKFLSEVKVSPDGRTIASAACDGTVRIWDVPSKGQVLSIPAHPRVAFCLGFSPDATRLVSGGDDGRVKVWNTRTGKEVLSVAGPGPAVLGVAFSPDGTRIASAGCSYDKQGNPHSGCTKVWDAHTGEELRTLRGVDEGANCVAFSPDGKRLVCGGRQSVTVWDAETGQQLVSFRAHDDLLVALAFSPDGQRLATASYDKTVKLWDAAGEPVWTFRGHTARVTCVAFSPDGQRLASGGDDNVVRIIAAANGEETLSLKGTFGPVHTLAFGPGGHLLVSGGWDCLLRVWDARPLARDGGAGTPPQPAPDVAAGLNR
jgi:WD40 repeat protein/tRNA A-37 threonylcarbamoyl transferase component Bud32